MSGPRKGKTHSKTEEGKRQEDPVNGRSHPRHPRSQTPVWERPPPKLLFRTPPRPGYHTQAQQGRRNRSFASVRSQTGVWERGPSRVGPRGPEGCRPFLFSLARGEKCTVTSSWPGAASSCCAWA